MAGGDTGGKLGGIINLATSTVSSAASQIFNTATDTFLLVGSLNTARESAAAVALPNGLTLIVGGSDCSAATYGGDRRLPVQRAADRGVYNETTKTFTLAGSGSGGLMTIARSGPSATLISGSGTALDGQVLIVGGSTGSSFLSPNSAAGGRAAGTDGAELGRVVQPGDRRLHRDQLDPGMRRRDLRRRPAPHGLASVCAGPTSAISSCQ